MSFNYSTSLSALTTAQTLIKTGQQNVSNMNTEGYIRQVVQLNDITAGQGNGVLSKIGSGVKVTDIKLITDEILSQQYNTQLSSVGYFKTLQESLYVVETLMGEYSDDSLTDVFQNFFNAWEEFSKFPEEASYRFSLIGETNKLTQKISTMSKELSTERTVVDNRLSQEVEEVNVLLKQLADINNEINESGLNVPNSLLNDRNQYLEKLSNYLTIKISYENNNPNVVTVRSDGGFLLEGNKAYELKVLTKENNEVVLTNGQVEIKSSKGSLLGNLDAINKYILPYEQKLEVFYEDLKQRVNDLHSNGFSINGDTGIDFFVGSSISTFAINPLIEQDVTKIASASVSGNEGDIAIARAIAAVPTDLMPSGGNLKFNDYISGYAIEMAQDLNSITLQNKVQEQVLVGIQSEKDSVEGVNLEEEMTNLMMFQKYFNANAKILQTVDETFDSILQII